MLVMETVLGGHQADHLKHLLEYQTANAVPIVLSLLVHPQLVDCIAEAAQDSDRAKIMPLNPDELEVCTRRNLSLRSVGMWFTMMKYLKATNAQFGHFMYLDHLQLPLALGFPIPENTCLSGVLFRPSVHYQRWFSNCPSTRERLRDARKFILYGRMLRHRGLHSVFSLDPYFVSYARQRWSYGSKVCGLPDPNLFPCSGSTNSAWVDWICAIPDDRLCFILFGVLTERKGILQLLNALAKLENRVARRIAVVLAGKVDKPLRSEIAKKQREVLSNVPDIWLHLQDEFIAQHELVALVQRCDVVLAPYQRFVGSSGVIMWAAGARKPVIAQDYGLMGALVRQHQLGIAVDTTKPAEICAAIQKCVAIGPDKLTNAEAMTSFVAPCTPVQFAQAIFDRIMR